MWVTERSEQVLDIIVRCHPIRSHFDEEAMHDYTVIKVARSGSEHALCLADAAGEYHVARATAAVPAPGTRLLGNTPALGFSLLLGTSIDRVYRVIFEAVHCTETEAHDSVHGSLSG